MPQRPQQPVHAGGTASRFGLDDRQLRKAQPGAGAHVPPGQPGVDRHPGRGRLVEQRDAAVVHPQRAAQALHGSLAHARRPKRVVDEPCALLAEAFTSLATNGPPSWVVLPLVFIGVAAILAGPAEAVGRCFGQLDNLIAYRWDLIGSLTGIIAFTLLSWWQAPSVVWGVLATAAYLTLLWGWRRVVAGIACGVTLACLTAETLTPGISWSPYYKVRLSQEGAYQGKPLYLISVNGVPHQLMGSADFKLTAAEAQYRTPYERRVDAPLRNVLIIGAGSGSDVSIALTKGAEHVDAVDIDPRIMQIGAELNPDHPYSDPRVTRHVNDGRAFLQSTDTEYDLILFALPDSLALVNGASQIRLESYLFTAEALREARDHLTDQGVFAMYNYYREDWLIDRLGNTALQTFGHAPCMDIFTAHQAVVTVAKDLSNQQCAATNHLIGTDVVVPADDDAPFLYFRGGFVPAEYLWVLGGILVISVLTVRILGGPLREMRPYADLFFMGAAFLLLETKNIATFALLFGTTWLVNALVFAGVLLVVLAAVETTRRFRTPPLPVVYGGIAAAQLVAYLVPPDALLPLPFWPRLAVAVVLAFLPIFLANVAFAKRFAQADSSQAAFGLNLLGAIVGGCLEYAALVTGYRNLLVVVALLYLAAFLFKPRTAVG
ncbi:MAG: spermidine synthase [Micropruina sp.]|nr:spermidine synthase [Micropruina sp.]